MKSKKLSIIVFAFLAVLCLLAGFAVLNIASTSAEPAVPDDPHATIPAENFSKGDMLYPINDIVDVVPNTELPVERYTEGSRRGVAVLGNIDGATFGYRNMIDLNNYDKNTNIISLQVLSDGTYAPITDMNITFTDVHDPTNQVIGRFVMASPSTEHSYAMVNYDGRTLGRSEADGTIWTNGRFGCTVYESSFVSIEKGKVSRPFSIQFDYAERQVYTHSRGVQYMVLDLDDPSHVGAGNEWKGFTTGEVYLSVTMTLTAVKPGGVVVTELLGHSMAQDLPESNDYSKPVIRIKEDPALLNDMPAGTVGERYPIPEANVTDWMLGSFEPEVRVFKNDVTDIDVTHLVKDGYFTPETAGEYSILYSGENGFGNRDEQRIEFSVLEYSAPVIIAPATEFPQMVLNTRFIVPEFYVSGGSGPLAVTETVEYAGETFALGASRSILIDRISPLKITVAVEGYTEKVVQRTFFINFSSETMLKVAGMPAAFLKGSTVTLPAYTAFDYDDPDTPVVCEITIDGVAVGEDRMYTVNKESGDTVRIKYAAGDVERLFDIPVIDPQSLGDYFLCTGEVSVKTDMSATRLSFSENCDVRLANPVAADGLTLKFTASNDAKYEYFDIVLTDFYDETNTVFFRIRPYDADTSVMQINGRGTEYRINGSFSSDASQYFLIFDGLTGMIKNNKGNDIAPLDGMTCEAAFVSLRFGGVYDASAFSVLQISNQVFNTANYMNGDNKAPVVVTETALSAINTISYGESFTVPAARAYDALDPLATVRATVSAPDGSVIYEGDCSTAHTFTGNDYNGYYVLTYEAEDTSGNTQTQSYRFKVRDEVRPLLTLTGEIVTETSRGTVYNFATASVTDNLTADCPIVVYVVSRSTYEYITVENGGTYTFMYSGEYEVVYYTRDDAFNVVEYRYSVTVR